MKTFLLLVALFLLAPFAGAQGQAVNATVVNEGGTPIAGAQIWVCGYPGVAQFPCSNTIPVYGEIGLTVQIQNPVTSDQLGNYSYFVPNGTYREDITGPNVQPHTRTLTFNGFGCSNIVAGTNITVSCTNSVVTVNSTGLGGCNVSSLVHTWVLSISPDATCYGSANFTWNDASGAQNLQAGLSNTPGTALTFLLGSSLNAAGSNNDFSLGLTNTQTCYQCGTVGDRNTISEQAGTTLPAEIYVMGELNAVTENVNAMSGGSDVHIFGSSNTISMDTNTADSILSVWILGEAATVEAEAGGSVNVASVVGKQNTLNAQNSTSTIIFMSVIGHGNTVEGNPTWEHTAVFGDANILNWANTSATNFANTVLGYGNLLQDNSGSNSVAHTTVVGYGNSVSGTTSYAAILGQNETITGCTHCYLFGENGSISTNSFVGVGLSATPELAITTGVLTFNGTLATGTNCKANGTAANPSVAACGASIAGMFSCATNASTGTCQVNSTAVTSNSEILITQDQADGGASQLNVTCNTGNVLNTSKPLLVSKANGASFTINLGTVSTNPACFEYQIIN